MLAFLFPPTAAAGSFRTLRFVKYLPEFGWDPLVVTTHTRFTDYSEDEKLAGQIPAGTIVERTNVWNIEESLFGGIRRLRGLESSTIAATSLASTESSSTPHNGQGIGSGIGQWLRQLRDRIFFTPDYGIAWSSFAIRAAKSLIKRHQVSVLYSTGPPHSTHIIARRLKRMTGLPWVADFRDPWARKPWAKESRPVGEKRMEDRLEARCVRTADRVILNTDAVAGDFLRTYPDQAQEKFVVIPNGFDPGLLELVQESRRAAGDVRQRPFRICHPGSLYAKRDPRPFLHALKRVANGQGNVQFEQIGHVDPSMQLDEFVRHHELQDCVRVDGMLGHDATLRRMAEADAFLVVQTGFPTQVPGKLYEMIPFGKPIMALAEEGQTADLIDRYGLGAVADPGNIDRITDSLRLIVEGRRIRQADRQLAIAAFNGRNLVKRLGAELSSISARAF